MRISGSRILVTGASGGIGRALALELARRGADLALLARDAGRLASIADAVRAHGVRAVPFQFDLARRDGHAELAQEAIRALGGLEGLVNNAGLSSFSRYADQTPEAIARLIDVNVNGPLLLTHAVLPHFLQQRAGHLVNIGSILGSIAFAHFAAYSASKFALRGFSEALRRELVGTGVRVTYVAPRTTETAMNSASARAFMAETGAAVDTPDAVACLVVDAMERDRAEVYAGRAERVFIRINSLAARLVDRSLARQNGIAQRLLRSPRP